MSLSIIAPFLVTLIMLLFAIWYSYQTYKGVIQPALSTWIIMLTGTSLSLITFLLASNWDIKSGILNIADVMTCIILLTTTIIWSKSKVRFRPFEKYYLFCIVGILIVWFVSRNPYISNLLVQLLILIGYFPTIQKLISEKKNTESYSAWFIALSSGFIGAIPVLESRNFLSFVYVGRTIIMISIILLLMYFYDRKTTIKK